MSGTCVHVGRYLGLGGSAVFFTLEAFIITTLPYYRETGRI